MSSKIGLLARMLGRQQRNPVVSQLYVQALGQPLLVHPSIGERLIGAYLDGAVDAPDAEVASTSGSIAVLNISGAMVNRPTPGLCGPGPLSYVEIRQAFDAAIADDNVSAIVFRMNSPGGMASGCFDLTDHIFASRGRKPIVAQIDDMAYSGCYAMAAACDSIQVTRTGGGGSIGVYTYHVDESEANAKAGVKVTYIFAGGKKVDGNSDEPLSDSARADSQAGVDRLYSLFTGSVAKYRSLDVQAVIDTEAGCFDGEELVAVGLADSVGTLGDLLQRLSNPPPANPPVINDTTEEVDMSENEIDRNGGTTDIALTEEQSAQIARAQITDAIMAAGLAPAIAVALLDPKAAVTVETATPRIAHARTVADLCAAAKLRGLESGFITRNTPIEEVRTSLQAAVADPSEELVTAHPQPKAPDTKRTSKTQDIYERRRAAAAGNGSTRGNR